MTFPKYLWQRGKDKLHLLTNQLVPRNMNYIKQVKLINK
ncbi:hypothetical protein PAUR_a3777 [Pseudoalteromonas aurantia 208]|uniref:Uncharacterized protein n=1 Tax=Pseudoalteromonas aurantia 208 TaxID=1314867 RepID=A0ABR9E6W0_9GAMM|nr:hypothetical protein [Pseudoalteromonas aurantia 208]